MNSFRYVAAAAALSLVTGAATPSTGSAFASNSSGVAGQNATFADATPAGQISLAGDLHPYLGPLPEPMPLSPAPDLNEPDAYVAYLQDLSAVVAPIRRGGADALAAWMTLLITTGTPVLNESGAPISLNGQTGTGYAVTAGELRLIGALGATPGGMTVADLGDALEGIPGLEGAGVAQALFESIQLQGVVWDVVVATYSTAFSFLSREPFRFERPSDPAAQQLSWAQVVLVLTRLANEAVIDGAGLASPSTAFQGVLAQSSGGLTAQSPSVVTVGLASVDGPRVAAAGPCGIENENVKIIVDAYPKVVSVIFGSKFDKIFEQAEVAAAEIGVEIPSSLVRTQKLLKAVGLAQTIGGFLAILTKAAALTATFELDAPPLVRTKNQHPGEVKDVRVSMKVDFGLYQEIVTCLNKALSPTGIQVPMVETGPAGGIPMDLFSEDPILLIGDGIPGGAPDTSRTTDADGMTSFKVSGAPQTQKIPESAERKEVVVVLRALAALEGNDLKKDLFDLPIDAISGPIGGGIQKVLARTKLFSFYGAVRVVDWNLYAVFDATLTANQRDHQAFAQNVITKRPCSAGLYSSSGDQEFDVHSDTVRVDAALLQNPQGNWGDQAVILLPHDQPFPPYGSPNDSVDSAPVLFLLPSTIQVNRQEHKPGLAPLPQVEDYQLDCTGGGGDPGGGGRPAPTPDCGAKSYRLDMGIVVPQPRRLYPFPKGDAPFDLYQNCITMDDTPGTFVSLANSGRSVTVTGGVFPAIEEVFDQTIGKIEILGTATYHYSEPGWRDDQQFEWTLTLCRVVDSKPAC